MNHHETIAALADAVSFLLEGAEHIPAEQRRLLSQRLKFALIAPDTGDAADLLRALARLPSGAHLEGRITQTVFQNPNCMSTDCLIPPEEEAG